MIKDKMLLYKDFNFLFRESCFSCHKFTHLTYECPLIDPFYDKNLVITKSNYSPFQIRKEFHRRGPKTTFFVIPQVTQCTLTSILDKDMDNQRSGLNEGRSVDFECNAKNTFTQNTKTVDIKTILEDVEDENDQNVDNQERHQDHLLQKLDEMSLKNISIVSPKLSPKHSPKHSSKPSPKLMETQITNHVIFESLPKSSISNRTSKYHKWRSKNQETLRHSSTSFTETLNDFNEIHEKEKTEEFIKKEIDVNECFLDFEKMFQYQFYFPEGNCESVLGMYNRTLKPKFRKRREGMRREVASFARSKKQRRTALNTLTMKRFEKSGTKLENI